MLLNYFQIFTFFTTWNIMLIIFNKFVYNYINLLYTSFITLFIGLYLSFINPRKFIFRFGENKYIFTGWEKFISVDITFHIIAFLYIFYKYFDYYNSLDEYTENKLLMISVILIFIYIGSVNVKKVYGISLLELIIIFSITNIIYFIIF
jgi:hypothetical protein